MKVIKLKTKKMANEKSKPITQKAKEGSGKAKVPIKRKENGIIFFNFIRYLIFTNNRYFAKIITNLFFI